MKILRSANAISLIIAVSLFFMVLINTFSPYPGVTPDELTYQRQAFFPVPGEIGFGNQLFSVFYGLSESCGDAWYQCVKSFNFMFLIVFAVAVASLVWFGTFRLSLSMGTGLFAFFSFSSYTSYFMPDTMLGALLAIAVVGLIVGINRQSRGLVVLSGIFMAGAMLTKPHAFFVWFGVLTLCVVLLARKRHTLVSSYPLLLAGFLLVSISIRSAVAVASNGLEGLNPLANYFSIESIGNLFSDSSGAGDGGSQRLETGAIPVQNIGEALIAAVTNLVPAIVMLSWILLTLYLLFGAKLNYLLSNTGFQITMTSFVSLVLMTMAFSVLLELRGSEEIVARALTRYWEYSWVLFAAGALTAALQLANDSENSSNKMVLTDRALWRQPYPYALIIIFLLALLYIQFIPKGQTAVDSGFLYSTYLVFGATLVASLLLSASMRGLRSPYKLAIPLIAVLVISGSSSYRLAEFLVQEKSGVIAGNELSEIMKRYPQDLNDIAFVGESSSANTASFIAKLPYTNRYAAGIYDEVEYDSFEARPRWVFASKEVSVSGYAIQTKILGDMIMYEFGSPRTINAAHFERYGVTFSGALSPTYWGAWARDGEVTLTMPDYFSASVLELNVMVSDQLEDTYIEIDYGLEPVRGSVEGDQIITPITLVAPEENFWASREITISYAGNEEAVLNSSRGLSLGVESLKNYD